MTVGGHRQHAMPNYTTNVIRSSFSISATYHKSKIVSNSCHYPKLLHIYISE